MPRGDGKGPMGGGKGGGQGQGRGQGAGQGTGRAGRFGFKSAGPGGKCVCPSCGETVSHSQGVPCANLQCPKCGQKMTRQD